MALALPLMLALAAPGFAHPPDIVRITSLSTNGRSVTVRGQVAYDGEPDGAYFVAWNFGDGSAPVIVTNNEQDAQGYTPEQSHSYPRRAGVRWYTLSLWGYEHHGDYQGRSDSRTVVVTCILGMCRSNVVPESCQLCSAPLELDLPTSSPAPLSVQEGGQSDPSSPTLEDSGKSGAIQPNAGNAGTLVEDLDGIHVEEATQAPNRNEGLRVVPLLSGGN